MNHSVRRILVLCTGNSCRSQMAEGYLRRFLEGKADVLSAGVEAHGVNARAIAVMKEDGIDISGHVSKTVEAFVSEHFDHVITVCDSAKERCPWFPSAAELVHHDFPDPAMARGTDEQILMEFRRVREMIKVYCEEFVRMRVP